MKEGKCDALLLAYAGVHRMGYSHMIVQELPTDRFIPAVGQGSLAIETSTSINDSLKVKIREALNHPDSENLLLAERAFLKKLEGGCSIPAFALAEYKGEEIEINAGIFSLDGTQLVKKQKRITSDNASQGGAMLADDVLSDGGDKILKQIRQEIN